MEQSGCNMKCAGSMHSGLYKGLRWLEFPKAKFGSPRNLKNRLLRNIGKTGLQHIAFGWNFVGFGLRLFSAFFPIFIIVLGKHGFGKLLRFATSAPNPYKSQHVFQHFVGFGVRFGMSKFPPTIFPFLQS